MVHKVLLSSTCSTQRTPTRSSALDARMMQQQQRQNAASQQPPHKTGLLCSASTLDMDISANEKYNVNIIDSIDCAVMRTQNAPSTTTSSSKCMIMNDSAEGMHSMDISNTGTHSSTGSSSHAPTTASSCHRGGESVDRSTQSTKHKIKNQFGTTLSSSHHTNQERRSVRFSNVLIREYDRTVGDNPSCSTGPPLSIDWTYNPNMIVYSVDDYEEIQAPFRRMQWELSVPRRIREEILLFEWNIPRTDVVAAVSEIIKIKNQRRQTIHRHVNGWEKVDTILGRTGSVILNKLKKRRQPNQKGNPNRRQQARNQQQQQSPRSSSVDGQRRAQRQQQQMQQISEDEPSPTAVANARSVSWDETMMQTAAPVLNNRSTSPVQPKEIEINYPLVVVGSMEEEVTTSRCLPSVGRTVSSSTSTDVIDGSMARMVDPLDDFSLSSSLLDELYDGNGGGDGDDMYLDPDSYFSYDEYFRRRSSLGGNGDRSNDSGGCLIYKPLRKPSFQ